MLFRGRGAHAEHLVVMSIRKRGFAACFYIALYSVRSTCCRVSKISVTASLDHRRPGPIHCAGGR